jgi:hypothetical protein
VALYQQVASCSLAHRLQQIQLLIQPFRPGYLENQVTERLLEATAEIGRMLNGLLAALKQ